MQSLVRRSKSAIYSDPDFPLPINYTEGGRLVRRSRWLKHEVIGWLQERIAERDRNAEARRQLLIAKRERKRQRAASGTASASHRGKRSSKAKAK